MVDSCTGDIILAHNTSGWIYLPVEYAFGASLVAQLVKNLTAMQETPVQFLGWEDPLEKEQLPTPIFWPGKFPGLYSPLGYRVRHDWVTFTSMHSRNSMKKGRVSFNRLWCNDFEKKVNVFISFDMKTTTSESVFYMSTWLGYSTQLCNPTAIEVLLWRHL